MNNSTKGFIAGAALVGAAAAFSSVAEAGTPVPLKPHSDLDTFYISATLGDDRAEDYLVDTGAGYMTITEDTRDRLLQTGEITRVMNDDGTPFVLRGKMANGEVLEVPVYLVSEITLGADANTDSCILKDVEVAVLPGASRGLFGLSALRKASPFRFSIDPPELTLSNCLETVRKQPEQIPGQSAVALGPLPPSR